MADLLQFSLDPTVAPGRVVGRHADDEGADRLHDARATDAFVRVGPLRCDQTVVPAQDGVRRDDRRDLGQELSTESLALGCEPPALVVGQPETLSAELLLEDAILLDEVVDGLGLMAVDPAHEGGEQKLQSEKI